MGSMQFLVPQRSDLAELATSCGYLVGHDGTPWKSRIESRGDLLVLTSESRESGRLVTPWHVPGYGTLALSTSTLAERSQPYHLGLELFRGTLYRVLDYEAFIAREEAASDAQFSAVKACFVEAALGQSDSQYVLEKSDQGLALCMSIMQQQVESLSPTSKNPNDYASRFTGFEITAEEASHLDSLRPPGNSFAYCPSWRELEPNPGEWEWQSTLIQVKRLSQHGRGLVCGPLLSLEPDQLPDWLYLWEDDFDALQSYICSYVKAAAAKLESYTQIWHVTSGTNVDCELKLSEEQRLRLTLTALETLRQVDSQTPTIVGIKQPWGDYMGRGDWDLSPWQFADIIVRSGIPLTGFALQLDFACKPGRTMPRDLVEIERQLDLWASFGKPLVVSLSSANDAQPDRAGEAWIAFLRNTLSLLQKKQYVQGIYWSPLLDRPVEQSGVYDAKCKAKPWLGELSEVWSSREGSM